MRVASVLWNLFGLGIPLLIAATTIPSLIAQVGAERFGLLALAWGLIGYAGALDLGIGRATTQRIAAHIGSGNTQAIADVLATAIRITQYSGVVGGAVIGLGALLGVHRVIGVDAVADAEIQWSMLLLALALPLQAISATYRGVNEAYLNFRGISMLRIVLGAANFGGPFLVSFWSQQLYWLVGTLVLSRAVALLVFRQLAHGCIAQTPDWRKGNYNRRYAKEMLAFGGWFTVSSLLNPLLTQADRFLVGALLSATAVTAYVLPYEIVMQTLILVGSVTSVIFPAITALMATSPSQANLLFKCWLKRVGIGMFVFLGILFAIFPALLELWVGSHVSESSAKVGQILCVGVFFNSIGAMYFAMLHAHGHARTTAIIHIIEAPIFLVVLYALVVNFGIEGAAAAWVFRVFIDTLMLIYASTKKESRFDCLRQS